MNVVANDIETDLDREVLKIVKKASAASKFGLREKEIRVTDFFSDKMLMILVIREGVTYSLFNRIQHFTPFTDDNWADFLDISLKSLQRYRQTRKTFKSIQSEKIIEIAEVSKAGIEVFGDAQKFSNWLDTPCFSLGGIKPIDLLKDSYGKDIVLGELTRINHGILA